MEEDYTPWNSGSMRNPHPKNHMKLWLILKEVEVIIWVLQEI